ncbi:AAA family ATPase [Chungangia koreensis]|uniref:AAA family ATPase n=1 Tax=Chungangia koreensis TaxID=752657 RepID=A0ABV8X3R0_9LACT
MIILINGAFGAGKTTVAEELLHKIKGSMIYDPEVVGYMLRHIIPDEVKADGERTGDFQDLRPWKTLVVKVAEELKSTYGKHLLVPMTIRNKEYFSYIVEGFKRIDPDTFHFCLMASKETIFERLRKRGEEEGNWCFQQTDRCLDAFEHSLFEQKIWTEEMTVEEIVKEIIRSVGH